MKATNPKHPDSKENALTEKEVTMFEQAIETPYQAFVYICCGIFGMRISEVAHLREDWFDLTEGAECIRIPRQMKCDCSDCKRKRGGVWKPKTRAGARTIPGRIDLNCFYFIYNYVKNRPHLPCTRSLWSCIKTVARNSGIEHNVFPHALRATAATRIAAMKEIDSVRLMSIMGWDSLKVADDYIRASGVNVLRIFMPKTTGQDVIVDPSFVPKKKEEPPPKLKPYDESRRKIDVCTVCGASVKLNWDNSWECSECGATSDLMSLMLRAGTR